MDNIGQIDGTGLPTLKMMALIPDLDIQGRCTIYTHGSISVTDTVSSPATFTLPISPSDPRAYPRLQGSPDSSPLVLAKLKR
jgi:hypothetical protein